MVVESSFAISGTKIQKFYKKECNGEHLSLKHENVNIERDVIKSRVTDKNFISAVYDAIVLTV